MSAQPRAVPAELRWRQYTNVLVLLGSGLFGIGIVWFMAVAPNTAVLSTWRLSQDRREAPGWLSGSRTTHYTENDVEIYRYDYSFLLPNESRQVGISYAGDRLHRNFTAARLANPGRSQDVTVEFYPGDPRINRIKGTNAYLCSPHFLWLLTIPIAGILMTLGGLAHGRRKVRLLQRGVLTEATIASARVVKTPGDHRSLEVGAGGLSFSIGSPDATVDEVDSNLPAAEQRQRARRAALSFGSRSLIGSAATIGAGLVISLGSHLINSKFWAKPNSVDAALAAAGRWWRWTSGFGWSLTLFGALACIAIVAVSLLIYFLQTRLGGLIQRRQRLAKGGSVEEFRELQIAQQEQFNRLEPSMLAVGTGCSLLLALFFAVWAGIAAFVATGFFMSMRGDMHGDVYRVLWTGGVVATLVAAATFALVVRWARRKAAAGVDGLQRASPTDVECTYEFQLPDGGLARGTDRLPLPTGPDDMRARLVLYDPLRPDSSQRLFGFSPPIRLSAGGEWEWTRSGSWMLRLALVIMCWMVAPVVAWLAASWLK